MLVWVGAALNAAGYPSSVLFDFIVENSEVWVSDGVVSVLTAWTLA